MKGSDPKLKCFQERELASRQSCAGSKSCQTPEADLTLAGF